MPEKCAKWRSPWRGFDMRINAILGEDVNYGFEGGPRYKTVISDTSNGMEDRASMWRWPKYEFRASYGYLQDDARDALNAFFQLAKGRFHSFMVKDWNDYTIVDQPLTVGAVGTTEAIQLYKSYTISGPYVRYRPIQAFKSCTIIGPDNLAVAGSYDLLAGTFTPSNAWVAGAHKISSAEFYTWVRFDDDYNPMTLEAPNATTAKVSLKEDPFEFSGTNVPTGWGG